MKARHSALVAGAILWFVLWYLLEGPLAQALGDALEVEVEPTVGGTWETVPDDADGWGWVAAAGIGYHALLLVPFLAWWVIERRRP